MSSVKVAITIDSGTLERVDSLVAKKVFPNRSRAIQSAVAEKLAGMERSRLASECAKLDPKFEISQIRTLAVERIGARLGRASSKEISQVVEGLNEIVGN